MNQKKGERERKILFTRCWLCVCVCVFGVGVRVVKREGRVTIVPHEATELACGPAAVHSSGWKSYFGPDRTPGQQIPQVALGTGTF